ncbi:MAG: hypothetical protein ACRCZP_14550, partial [Phycicoccus sp.]
MTVNAYQPDQPHQSEQSAALALRDWADAAAAAHRIAQSLVGTSFVPAAFRGKPEEATAAILSGMEVGLNPMAALRSYDIIQGVAAPRALTQRAILQSAGHEVWVHESTDTRAIVRGRRAGSDIVQESEWTIARARELRLTGKDQWQRQPKAMLVARATAELCRMVAADAILGIPYAAEELGDDTPGPVAATTARTMRRRAPAAAVQPPTEPAGPAAVEVGESGPLLPD